ncbi:MAG: cysteine desulfurase [Candidatus Magasanikbacteria bacterium]|nr:cysteine desulfurase [Candidatus Magasanikbacteria bacterium]
MLSNIKKTFPIFQNHPQLRQGYAGQADFVYLDSASTTQTPQVVLDAMNSYYTNYRANIHRGVYKLSAEATEMYEGARKVLAKFINAQFEEIIFTSGSTEGLNMLAQTLGSTLKKGDNVVLTRMEHHANLIPWQEASKRYGFEIRWIELENYELRIRNQELAKAIDEHTKIVSIVHVSNTLGTINPIEEIIAQAKKVGAITIIDAAQSVAHMPIDVKKLDCDFLVFSGHKMYGPTGIGVVYGKRERLEVLQPYMFGGDMIKEVTFEKATWHDIPWKFEAGTPNIAGAIGLAAAVQFIDSIGFEKIQEHEQELCTYALEELQKIPGLGIIGPQKNRVGVISFTLNSIHSHDIATILDQNNIAVRAGHHCTMPLMQHLGLTGTTRVSFGVYNNMEDVDQLINGIKEVQKIFS